MQSLLHAELARTLARDAHSASAHLHEAPQMSTSHQITAPLAGTRIADLQKEAQPLAQHGSRRHSAYAKPGCISVTNVTRRRGYLQIIARGVASLYEDPYRADGQR